MTGTLALETEVSKTLKAMDAPLGYYFLMGYIILLHLFKKVLFRHSELLKIFDNAGKCKRKYLLTTVLYLYEAKLKLVVDIMTLFYGFRF